MVRSVNGVSIRAFAGAAAFYLIVTAILTYPVAWHLSDELAGYPDGDNTQAMWSSWWYKAAFLDLRTQPDDLSLLYYPDGYTQPLISVTPYTDISTLPLQLLTNPVVSYNVAWLAAFFLSALFAYLLCYQLTGSHWAALLGGFVFGFAPTRIMHGAAGHFSQSTAYWMPLCALFAVRLVQRPSRRAAVLCGVFLALSGLVSLMHIAYFVVPFTCAVVLWAWWMHGREPERGPRFRYYALAAVVAAAVVSPFYVPFLWNKLTSDWQFLFRFGTVQYSADLLAFLTPSPYHPLFGRLPFRELLEKVVRASPFENLVFVGWLPLFLAWYARREKTAVMWAGLAVAAGVLALGPLLKVGGEFVTYAVDDLTTYVPMPYALVKQLPLFDMGRTPSRLALTVMLCMAALSAMGLARLLRSRDWGRAGVLLPVIVVAVVVFEFLTLWPMPTTPAPSPALYRQIAGDGQEYAILDLPAVNRRVQGDSMYYQTIHRHPTTTGYIWRIPESGLLLMRFMDSLAANLGVADITSKGNEMRPAEFLSRYNIRYVALHKGRLPTIEVEGAYASAFSGAWGQPVHSDDTLSVYSVPPPSASSSDMEMLSAGEGWHPAESWSGEPTRWLGNEGTIIAYRPRAGSFKLQFNAYPFLHGRVLQIVVQGKIVDEVKIDAWQQVTTSPFDLPGGLTAIDFRMKEACAIPSETTGEEDKRCVTIAVQALELIPGSEVGR